jgi:signal transduction histidine kinase
VLPRLPEVDPDLIILDLHMPHLDGLAVLEQIRRFAPSEYLPVLVLTADTTSRASQQALIAGAQDFVTKPFNNAEVLLRTRNLLETRFLYTTLRGSIIRQTSDREREERRLTLALVSEQEAVARLRLRDGLKDILLQTVSHDLRNPITAVLTMTSMLTADAQGAQPLSVEMRLAIIGKVELSARQMDRLLKDLLDSDPMRKVSNAYQVCDVGELVRRVLAEVGLGADHLVVTDIASITVGVDPVHVERIVENLLTNARQHVAPGIPIWVKTAGLDDGVLISVEDAGSGITSEAAKTIFEPFQRGSDAGSPGLGLGLSLVSRFAQLHNGRAWVEDRPGGGASFHVFLPSLLADERMVAGH